MQTFNTIAAVVLVLVAIYYVWLQLFHRERKHTLNLCEFFKQIAEYTRYEQTSDGQLYPTHCIPEKCLHVDVYNWVWAWDRNIAAYIHYPAGPKWFGSSHA